MEKLTAKPKDHAFSRGLSFINVLIAVAVTTIILTMVIPTFSNYSIRAKTIKALSAAESAKNSIEYACLNDSSLTYLSRRMAGHKFKATKYAFDIEFGGDCKAPTITITT